MIAAITLDLDDTLWPIAPVMERCERVLHDYLATHAPTVAERFPAPSMRALREQVAAERPDLAHDYGALRRLSLQRAFDTAAVDAPDLVEAIYTVYYTTRNEVQLYDDVKDALVALSRRHRLAALTNGNADLERIGLNHLFHASISARDIGCAKPDARIFEHTCAVLGASASDIWHVGDDPLLDVVGAQRAGFRTVWMNRDGRDWPLRDEPPPDLTVGNLAEFERWVSANA